MARRGRDIRMLQSWKWTAWSRSCYKGLFSLINEDYLLVYKRSGKQKKEAGFEGTVGVA